MRASFPIHRAINAHDFKRVFHGHIKAWVTYGSPWLIKIAEQGFDVTARADAVQGSHYVRGLQDSIDLMIGVSDYHDALSRDYRSLLKPIKTTPGYFGFPTVDRFTAEALLSFLQTRQQRDSQIWQSIGLESERGDPLDKADSAYWRILYSLETMGVIVGMREYQGDVQQGIPQRQFIVDEDQLMALQYQKFDLYSRYIEILGASVHLDVDAVSILNAIGATLA